MFVDEANITIQAGDGGHGKVAFFVNRKGPCGGDGGKGGDVYFVVNSNSKDLKRFTQMIVFKAEDGFPGGSNRKSGAKGKDLFLNVPIHTTIVDNQTNDEITLTEKLSRVLMCQGGKGGFGNDALKTSTNQTPHSARRGEKGQEKKIKLILRLIADFGLIGLPNAGKSSLLNKLTNANVRTADYPFTTLEPNLGVMGGKILADIPGLIEGASSGKGLGIKFLKHIEKVALLLHCISVESEDIEKDYQTVQEEISKYNPAILTKKTIILLTKSDLVTKETLEEKIKTVKKFNDHVIPVSIYSTNSLDLIRLALSI